MPRAVRVAALQKEANVLNADEAFAQHSLVIGGEKKLQSFKVINALRSMGLNPTDAHAQSFVRAMDEKDTGFITLADFKRVAEAEMNSKYTLKDLEQMFNSVDVKRTGELNARQFRSILRSEMLSDEEIEEIMQLADSNSDGKIDLPEFVALMAPELDLGGSRRQSFADRRQSQSSLSRKQSLASPRMTSRRASNDGSSFDDVDPVRQEYFDKYAHHLKNAIAVNSYKANLKLDTLSDVTESLALADNNLAVAMKTIRGAFTVDKWNDDGVPCPTQSEFLRRLFSMKPGNQVFYAQKALGEFDKAQKEQLTEAISGEVLPLVYDPEIACEKDDTDELIMAHQLSRFMLSNQSILPPGLYPVTLAEGTTPWDGYEKEEELRAADREAFLIGLAGRDLDETHYRAHSNRAAHSLGISRALNGKSCTSRFSNYCFNVVHLGKRTVTIPREQFYGEQISALIPTARESQRTKLREMRTYGCFIVDAKKTYPEDQQLEEPETFGYTATYTWYDGIVRYYVEDHQTLASVVDHGGEGDIQYLQMMSEESYEIEALYSAALMDEPPPIEDPSWKAQYAYEIGRNHRLSVLEPNNQTMPSIIPDFFLAHTHVRNIQASLHYGSSLNGLKWGELVLNMERDYTTTDHEIKDAYNDLFNKHRELQALVSSYFSKGTHFNHFQTNEESERGNIKFEEEKEYQSFLKGLASGAKSGSEEKEEKTEKSASPTKIPTPIKRSSRTTVRSKPAQVPKAKGWCC